ncbi:putative plasmid-related transcriptional repressor protein [Cupriavidus sp. GA3-3]|uniref:plasmid replication initiator TrfA n=1 Tax=Cupriavidus TaxID=106589 RepID=UPI00032F098A|nr:plasmid replication initiator TrfA [Cupriavidus sp. GA3-3]EON21866.1 putative plasmid-related transcriptional repressor protein [Cupriavidus sp. GA3-3]
MALAGTEVETHVQGKKRDSLAFIHQMAADAVVRIAAKKEQEAASPKRLFLPGLDDFMRAMPNHIARSSLFAPVGNGMKSLYKDAVLESRADARIIFSGEQLDESQADVWMQAMHEASKVPLGEPVTITRKRFLESIGRHVGNWEYDWLYRTMRALSFAMLTIEVRSGDTVKLKIGTTPKSDALHMIDGLAFDPETDEYKLRIDPRWHAMYSNREWARIDWSKRMQFAQGQHMAKALQRLVATSNETTQRHQLEWLKRKLAYTSPMRKFRRSLKATMLELERLKIVAGGRIERSTKGKEQAVWTKL